MKTNETPPQNPTPLPPTTVRTKEPPSPKQVVIKSVFPQKAYNLNPQPKVTLFPAESKTSATSLEPRKSKILQALANPNKDVAKEPKAVPTNPPGISGPAKSPPSKVPPNLKQNIQQPKLAMQPGLKMAPQKDTKETMPPNTITFKSIFKSGNQPKAAGPSKLVTKCSLVVAQQKGLQLQPAGAAKNEPLENLRKSIPEKDQKTIVGVAPHEELDVKKDETKLGVTGAAAAGNENKSLLEVTPLVKLLVKLADENMNQQNIDPNLKDDLQKDQLVEIEGAAVEGIEPPNQNADDNQAPGGVPQDSPIRKSSDPQNQQNENLQNLQDAAGETAEDDKREKKKAQLKEKFNAGVADPNLRKQFNLLLKQNDLNEVIDQMSEVKKN